MNYIFYLILPIILLIFFYNTLTAEILTFHKLSKYCSSSSKKINNTTKINQLTKNEKYEICKAYILGYLDVANHNCKFDHYTDNLHKLDTKNISIQQIIKALEIYTQMLSKNFNGTIIDNLWKALNPHWPCKN